MDKPRTIIGEIIIKVIIGIRFMFRKKDLKSSIIGKFKNIQVKAQCVNTGKITIPVLSDIVFSFIIKKEKNSSM